MSGCNLGEAVAVVRKVWDESSVALQTAQTARAAAEAAHSAAVTNLKTAEAALDAARKAEAAAEAVEAGARLARQHLLATSMWHWLSGTHPDQGQWVPVRLVDAGSKEEEMDDCAPLADMKAWCEDVFDDAAMKVGRVRFEVVGRLAELIHFGDDPNKHGEQAMVTPSVVGGRHTS